MSKRQVRRPQAPKPRNWAAKSVRDPDGPYRPKTERDRTKPTRKPKHPRQYLDEDIY